MAFLAQFRFHSSLNDFITGGQRNSWINYTFKEPPGIKDAIEALGVPHPEVNRIAINGNEVDFNYKLQPDDSVEVYPQSISQSGSINLIPNYNQPYKFVLDVHLGKLARLLRMLGFDTMYDSELTEKQLVTIAVTENRILLSRGVNILKHKSINYGYWLRSQQPDEQLKDVISYYKLEPEFRLFSRCMVCNGEIREVEKEQIELELPPKTKLYFQQFYKCTNCGRVYWKGSHYERMQQFISEL